MFNKCLISSCLYFSNMYFTPLECQPKRSFSSDFDRLYSLRVNLRSKIKLLLRTMGDNLN